MSAADPNVTSASTSSNSSTSLSPSDPFRNLRAALERHKPLGTTQSTSNMPRARRILVSRPQTTKSTLAKSSISSRNQNINAGTRKTASTSVPVSVPVDNNNTNNNTENELDYMVSVAPLDTFPTQNTDTKMENYATQNTDTKMENYATQNTDTKMENNPTENTDTKMKIYPTQNTEPKLVNYPTQNTETKLENYPTQNTETKLDHKVSTHMHSLALTEEANHTKMLQNLSTIFQGSNSNTIPQKGFEETTRLNPAITYPITHSIQINPNPITQCSVLNSSCITKQSTLEPCLENYENAPAEKKVSFQPESEREDKTEKKEKKEKEKEKEKEKDKSRKKGYDSEMFFKVNGKYYQKLGKIGSGGSSEVHKVISAEKNIFALKKIKLRGRDYPTALGFCQEIEYLNKLKGKTNIIQLIDYEITDKTLLLEGSSTAKEGRIKEDNCIYMVLEYGEIDLAHMVSQKWREANDSSALRINENWLRFYWQQILEAVNTIHEERIVHSDLKPANFLLVRGSLKLIDFGIAKAIMNDTTNIQRDAQAGTLNYMSPEAFLCNEEDSTGAPIKCGRPSDIWSLGCILYQMVYGKTPFADYTTFWAKFKVVTNRNHEISYHPVPNPWLIDLMRRCLAWDRNDRWRISELLKHPFLMPPALPMEGPVRRLMERIGSYWDRAEVKRLCGELGEVITRIEKEEQE